MTSLMRSLIRTSSTYTKPDASEANAVPTPAPSSPTSTLTNSPSFNDFSLGLSQHDADAGELASSMPVSGRPRGFSMDMPSTPTLRRESMDSQQQRSSLDVLSRTPSVLAAWGAGTIFSRSPAINIPAAKHAPEAPPGAVSDAPPPPDTPRRKNGKINGLDYYEWCELVRSSSL